MVLYKVKTLEHLKTHSLGALYFREFFLGLTDPDEPPQLELITEILRQRDFRERNSFYKVIKARYEKAVSEQDTRFAERLDLMIDHYERRILD